MDGCSHLLLLVMMCISAGFAIQSEAAGKTLMSELAMIALASAFDQIKSGLLQTRMRSLIFRGMAGGVGVRASRSGSGGR